MLNHLRILTRAKQFARLSATKYKSAHDGRFYILCAIEDSVTDIFLLENSATPPRSPVLAPAFESLLLI
jgi:hypothetical protein